MDKTNNDNNNRSMDFIIPDEIKFIPPMIIGNDGEPVYFIRNGIVFIMQDKIKNQ